MNLRHTVPTLMTLAGVGLAGCQPQPAVEPADLVLLNGKIITVDDVRPEAEALAARAGILVAIGTRYEIEPLIGPQTEVLDLEGAVAVPGFIEGHGHFMGLGDFRSQLDLRQARSWDAIVAQVAAAVAEAEPGQWIRGRGWHQEKWDAPPEPTVEGFPVHDSLSAVSPDNPVILTHASGHGAFVNAKALELAGIDATTPDPRGGQILHDDAGRPTGFLREDADELVNAVRERDPETVRGEWRRQAELASRECLAKGVTSFEDAGSSFEVIDFLAGAVADGTVGVRLWMMVRASNEELAEKLEAAKRRAPRFSVGGIKVVLDGALGSRGAWLLEPYSDAPGSTGMNLVPLDEVRRTAELAREHGVQLCTHAIGDRANREILDVYEHELAKSPDGRALRWRVEHAQHLSPDDAPRFAKLGVLASMQSVHCTSDGPWVPERLGDKRSAEGAYVWQSLLRSGARIVNGTDTPVEDVDPIANFYSGVSRRLPDGSVFYPDQRMTRMQALRSMTLDAAYGAFQEDVKGSLAVGKMADVVVLSRDLLTVDESEIPGTEVLYTIVDGRVVSPVR